MKKLLLVAAFGVALSSTAQNTYYTGFDNGAQTAGWQQFRKGYLSVSQWTLPTFGAYSAPSMLHHDYPVGSAGTDTTVDWYVSPAFNFSAGGEIDSLKVKIYSITGAGTPVDYLGLVLLQGSNDPALATQTELANLSGMVSSANVWEDTGSFVIPSTAGLAYIGIKYRATNNWFVTDLDNIHITMNATGMHEETARNVIQLYPNPAGDRINLLFSVHHTYTIQVYNAVGEKVITTQVNSSSAELSTSSLPAGMYTVTVQGASGVAQTHFIKQ